MKSRYDIAVIGAGPAGMAAAITAADHGASVVLFDEQPTAGGQIYRAVAQQRLADRGILGADYYHGLGLVAELGKSGVDHQTGSTVWQVTQDHQIGVSKDGKARLLQAGQIIIATGAMERPFPVPGWTLPGVMGAGAAQILLKSGGVALQGAVFVGTGPLLYLVAHQYLRAGVTIKAILDTTPRSNLLRALPNLPVALSQMGMLVKGRRWINELGTAGIPFIKGVQDIRCIGNNKVEAIEYSKGGRWNEITTKNVLLHLGVVPNTNLAVAAGCNHIWSNAQLCWHAQTGNWGESNLSGIAITGDGAAINGGLAGQYSGQISSLGALFRGGSISAGRRDELAAKPRKAFVRETRIRPFLDALFKPPTNLRLPPDNTTIVCRCEEVSVGEIRQAVTLGCRDPNQLKSFTRCMMGPCQGRFCALTASEIIAKETQNPIANIAMPRQRAPVKPLLLDELASLATTSLAKD